jgi:hypothetical protein
MTSDDDYDYIDAPMTVQDYIEIVEDALEEAEQNLDASDIKKLIAAVRKKLDALYEESEPVEYEEPDNEDAFSDLGYRRR